MVTILKPKDGTYALPTIADPSDLWAYIAEFNGFQYYETDPTGVTPNEILPNWFFIDKIELATPVEARSRMKFDGVLFIGAPSDISIDVNSSTFSDGQFTDIVKKLLNLGFANELNNYVACDFQIAINSLRPLYNSVKYTKATNCTGVEVYYSIWI
jgi:hypothetical protein